MTGPVEVAGDLVFVGDVHLDAGDRAIESFRFMLEETAATCSSLVLAGDLFNLWIGRKKLEQEHIGQVLETLKRIRSRGTGLHYLEGNRDYFIARHYLGEVFDTVTTDGLELSAGGHRIFTSHGDLANLEDRQYHAWRKFSRSAPVWWLFNRLPRRTRIRMAERAERRFRQTNREYKSGFPEEAVRAYAGRRFGEGFDLVVLGHFHLEKDLNAGPEGRGRILVLPEWKGSRRILRIRKEGETLFQNT